MTDKTWLDEVEEFLTDGQRTLETWEADMRKSLSRSHQAIIDLWEINCGDKWFLWVRTGVVAAAEAIWLLIMPTWEETLENYLEPRKGRRFGKGGPRRYPSTGRDRNGRPITNYGRGIPQIDEVLADMIPGAERIKGRRVSDFEFLMWKQFNVGERALWYFLLAQATETFTTTWLSGLAKSGECTAPNDGSAHFNLTMRDSFVQDELWFNKFALPDFFEEGLEVGNNGTVQLTMLSTVANWMVAITTNWTIQNDHATLPVVLEVGQKSYAIAPDFVDPQEQEAVQTVSVPPGSTITVATDSVFFFDAAHTIQHNVLFSVIENPGNWTVLMSGTFGTASRNTRFD